MDATRLSRTDSHPVTPRGSLLAAATGAVAFLLLGCGGGGGGSSPPPPPTASISVSTTTLSVSALTTDAPPTASFDVTVTSSVAGTNVYIDGTTTHVGISDITSTQTASALTVHVTFVSPATLGTGVYSDTITIKGCFDTACTQPVTNSPQTVAVHYTVTQSTVPAVTLTSLSPPSAAAAGPGFTLTATGTNFAPGAVIQWNGVGRSTVFLSTTQLSTQIAPADIAAAATVPVTVVSNTAVSNPVNFTITPPAPISLVSVSPTTVTSGGGTFMLTLQGASFTPSSVAQWNGTALTTTYVSATELIAQVPATDIANIGSAQVTVQDPGPPVATTTAATVTIAAPSIDAVSFLMTPAHTGAVSFKSLTLPASSKWSVDVGGTPSYALIVNGLVIVTVPIGSGSELIALDQATGATVWGPIVLGGTANAAYDAGTVFTVSSNVGNAALMQAFDVATGSQKWSTVLSGQYSFSSAPTARNGFVYTGGAGSGGTLYAVDQSNGVIAWTAGVANGDDSTPAVSVDAVYVIYPCQTYAFRPTTGESIWENSTGCDGGGGATGVVAKNRLYAPNGFGSYNGTTFDAETGANLGAYVADVPGAFTATTGFFLQSGTLRGVTLSNNTAIWSFAGDGSLTTSPIVVNQYVFIGSSTGNVYALDAATGAQVWTANVGGAIQHGAGWGAGIPLGGLAAGDGLLVVPAGTKVTAYTLSTSP